MCILTDKITVASFCFVYLVDSILSCEDSQNPANTSDRCRVLWLEICNRLEPYFLALGLIDRKRFLRRAAIDRIVQPDSTFRNETMRRYLNMLILPRE